MHLNDRSSSGPLTASEFLRRVGETAHAHVQFVTPDDRLSRLLHPEVAGDPQSPEPVPPGLETEQGAAGELPHLARRNSTARSNAEHLAVATMQRALAGQSEAADPPELRRSLGEHFDAATVEELVAMTVKDQVERIMRVVDQVAMSEASDDSAVVSRPQRNLSSPDYMHPSLTTPMVCPRCGHQLSLYQEPVESRANTAAGRFADAIGSWRYIVALVVVTLGYVSVALLMYQSNTEKAIVLNYLGIGMTTLVGIQTPLILLSQRRDASRDRARDREALRVANRTEYDLHAIREALDSPLSKRRPPTGS